VRELAALASAEVWDTAGGISGVDWDWFGIATIVSLVHWARVHTWYHAVFVVVSGPAKEDIRVSRVGRALTVVAAT